MPTHFSTSSAPRCRRRTRRPRSVVVAIAVAISFASIATAVAAAKPAGVWSKRFDPPTSMHGPLVELDGQLVAGEYKLQNGKWVLLGSGIEPTPSYIDDAVVDGSTLYVSGLYRFGALDYSTFVARWDGDAWTTLFQQRQSRRIPLAVFDGHLHAAFAPYDFTAWNSSRIARWDGAEWSSLGDTVDDEVRTLAVYENRLYAGGGLDRHRDTGDFDSRGMLARWDGDAWKQIGTAINGPVESLLAWRDKLYVGGCFTTVGSTSGKSAFHVATWNGSKWSAMGTGVGGDTCGSGGRDGSKRETVRTMVSRGNDLLVGGYFDAVGGVAAGNVARWDGRQWSHFGQGFNRPISSLLVKDGELFASGYAADIVDGAAIPGVKRWNGSSWRPVVVAGPTVGFVSVLESSGGEIYAGGIFETAGGTEAHAVAKWDGIGWSPLGEDLGGDVVDIAVVGKNVFVAGSLRLDPTAPLASHVAKWDGETWQFLDESLGPVFQIEAYQGKLYAVAKEGDAFAVVRWTGQSWKSIVTDVKGWIRSIEAGDKLYVSGNFSSFEGVEFADLAAWDGSQWVAFGDPTTWVDLLSWSGTGLYALGFFGLDSEFGKFDVARWNGTGWEPFGPSDAGFAGSITAWGDDVFVSGSDRWIDGVPTDGLAHWDGTRWIAVGRMHARSLAFVGDNLYAAGWLFDRGGNDPETVGLYALGTCGNGVLDAGEDCDHGIRAPGACCNVNTCRIAEAGTICRAERGPCDVVETCDGATSSCPEDHLRPAGFVCRQPLDGCQSTGVCDGIGLTCSHDPIAPCSDGQFCNGMEICAADGSCDSGLQVDCNDGDACTVDTCTEGQFCRYAIAPGPGCTECGDVNYDGFVSSLDALLALRGAVGLGECPPFSCDYDGSGDVTAADALQILAAAVGSGLEPACPGDVTD